jgi:CubicO group peptidase (beta-lactamase class C family)
MWHAEMARWENWSGIPRNETFSDAARCAPLAFEPGTGWAYGVGIDWAGRAVEAATGQTLNDYMHAHLLGPLGMHNSGFLLDANTSSRLAAMHRRGPDGALAAIDFAPSQNPAHFTGGGGMFSTGPDYLRFIRMMLNGGTLEGVRVLRPETVALMARNHMGSHNGVPLVVQPMRSAMPTMTNNVDLFPTMTKHWGLSFLITPEDVPGGRRAGSLTWAGLHNTYYWIDPASGLGGVLLTQLLPFADPLVLTLLDSFERAVYSEQCAVA